MTLDALREQAMAAKHGGSAYAPEGQRSPYQRAHDGREALELLARVAFAAGRAEGYAAGYEQGCRSGRLSAWRAAGPHVLIEVIERDLAAIRREVEA